MVLPRRLVFLCFAPPQLLSQAAADAADTNTVPHGLSVEADEPLWADFEPVLGFSDQLKEDRRQASSVSGPSTNTPEDFKLESAQTSAFERLAPEPEQPRSQDAGDIRSDWPVFGVPVRNQSNASSASRERPARKDIVVPDLSIPPVVEEEDEIGSPQAPPSISTDDQKSPTRRSIPPSYVAGFEAEEATSLKDLGYGAAPDSTKSDLDDLSTSSESFSAPELRQRPGPRSFYVEDPQTWSEAEDNLQEYYRQERLKKQQSPETEARPSRIDAAHSDWAPEGGAQGDTSMVDDVGDNAPSSRPDVLLGPVNSLPFPQHLLSGAEFLREEELKREKVKSWMDEEEMSDAAVTGSTAQSSSSTLPKARLRGQRLDAQDARAIEEIGRHNLTYVSKAEASELYDPQMLRSQEDMDMDTRRSELDSQTGRRAEYAPSLTDVDWSDEDERPVRMLKNHTNLTNHTTTEPPSTDDDPLRAEVRLLMPIKVKATSVQVLLQLTDVPRWAQEQPFFLHPEGDPGTIFTPQRYDVEALTEGRASILQFTSLEEDTEYKVKLNWSLKAPQFPRGWSFRTKLREDEEL